MFRYPEAQAHYISHFLTHLAPRRRERGSTDAGFPYRVGGTTSLLPARFGSDSERDPNDAVHPHVHHWVHSSDDASHRQLGDWTKRNYEFGRAQNTGMGGSDPTAQQNRCPVPSGFGSHSRLLLLEDAARVFGRARKENRRLCNTACQTKL